MTTCKNTITIACVGKPPKYTDGCQRGVTRYTIGPIPTEADERKSPRCPNCGGVVVQTGVVL